MIYDYLVSTSELQGYITLVCFVSGCLGICDYCYNRQLWKSHNDLDVQNVIKKIKESNKRYKLISAVSLSGGEPLLVKGDSIDFFKHVTHEFPDLYYNMDTSLTQGYIKDFTMYLNRCSVSVKEYWLRDEHVLANLEILGNIQVPVELRLVLTKKNVYTLKDILCNFFLQIRKLNLIGVRISAAIEVPSNLGKFSPLTTENFTKYYKEFEDFFSSKFGVRNVYSFRSSF